MRQWRYRALAPDGGLRQGRLAALDLAELEGRLGGLGLELLAAWPERFSRPQGRVPRQALAGFCFQLEHLLGAGIPVLQALQDLRDGGLHPGLREASGALAAAIAAGRPLSAAMAEFPKLFDPVFVALAQAGEVSGRLGEVLQELVRELNWQEEQARQARRVLTYPLLVLGVMLAVLGFLLTWLVPELLRFIQSMQAELPWHTRALLGLSEACRTGGPWALALTAAALALAAAAARLSPSAARRLDAWLLRVPVLGPLRHKLMLARFARTLALLYESGIPVPEGLRLAGAVVPNRALRAALAEAGRRIDQGAGLGAAFAGSALFPPLVERMLRVGETTGVLDTALLNAAEFLRREVQHTVERLQNLAGPVLTASLGAVLGWVMLAVLGPVYELVATLAL